MQPDRFTVKSQEAIAGAQQLAAANSNTEVAPAHLLVVLLEQQDGLVPAVLGKLGADLESIRSQARAAMSDLPRLSGGEAAEPRPSSAFVDVLQRAEGEMAGMGDEYVSTEHILLAIADSKTGLAEVLPDRDSLARAIAEVRGPHKVDSPNPEDQVQALEKYGRDLTADAESGKLDPVIGRDEEVRRVIQVLSRRTKNNPVPVSYTHLRAHETNITISYAVLVG